MIGATEKEGSVGRTVLWNLISNPFGGTVYPINAQHSQVLGIKAYPNVASVPEPIDLAVIVTPAPTVPGIVGECVAAGVKSAIIISAGFKEAGAAGVELERQIAEAGARQDASHRSELPGRDAPGDAPERDLCERDGAPRQRRLHQPERRAAAPPCSTGASARTSASAPSSPSARCSTSGWGDLIDFLGDDPHTQSIVIYMESIGDARSFISAAREVALTKPIIVIKAGRTAAAAKAAASHTGALAGSDEVLDAAFRRCGVLRVNSIADLFYMAEVLAKQPRPSGPRLTIVTNAGGPGVLATDALIADGGELAELSAPTMEALNKVLPPHWSHGNPIDILGDADPERYAQALEIAAKDPNSDGLLVVLTPQAMTDPTETARRLQTFAVTPGKPVLASWMGGKDVVAGEAILNQANIPTFGYPDTAARMFTLMWRYAYNLRGLYETPTLVEAAMEAAPDRARVQQIIVDARKSGRTLLTEFESKQVLAAYGIPTVQMRVATSEDEAVQCAAAIGYPVVLKLHSQTITHKTDVGGVQLNLPDADAVRRAYRAIESAASAVREPPLRGGKHFLGVTVQPMIKLDGYELIVGSSIDAQFGPVLLFGAGGQLVEVFRDRALALPPLNSTLARRMMEQTKIHKALKGVRGRAPVDLGALAQLLVRFSQLVVEQRWIKEIDINPLLAAPLPKPFSAGRRRTKRREDHRARCAHGTARTGPRRGSIAQARHSPLPDAICIGMDVEGWHAGHHSPHSPGGRTADRKVPCDPVGGERVHALLPRHRVQPARRASTPDAYLFYRLRPRDGAGRGSQRPAERRAQHSRGGALEQIAHGAGSRVRHSRQRRVSRAWFRRRAFAPARADRAR